MAACGAKANLPNLSAMAISLAAPWRHRPFFLDLIGEFELHSLGLLHGSIDLDLHIGRDRKVFRLVGEARTAFARPDPSAASILNCISGVMSTCTSKSSGKAAGGAGGAGGAGTFTGAAGAGGASGACTCAMGAIRTGRGGRGVAGGGRRCGRRLQVPRVVGRQRGRRRAWASARRQLPPWRAGRKRI